ncbi:hypothetical protein D3C85_991310 [compost metagenome]
MADGLRIVGQHRQQTVFTKALQLRVWRIDQSGAQVQAHIVNRGLTQTQQADVGNHPRHCHQHHQARKVQAVHRAQLVEHRQAVVDGGDQAGRREAADQAREGREQQCAPRAFGHENQQVHFKPFRLW